MTQNPFPEEPATFRLNYGFGSHRGLRRQLNEDSLVVTGNLFAVADGMGGHEAGEVASRICVETLAAGVHDVRDDLTPEQIQSLIGQADVAIREASGARAGTTLAGCGIVREDGSRYWMVFNVGDSRTYRLSEGELSQVSVDHSEVQELVDQGHISEQEARHHPRRHVITRALGTGEPPEADFWMITVQDSDRLMICSDGLTTEVEDEQIRQELAERSTPQEAVDALIQAALRNGGRDNITVIVVDVEDAEAVNGREYTPLREDTSATQPGAGAAAAGGHVSGTGPVRTDDAEEQS